MKAAKKAFSAQEDPVGTVYAETGALHMFDANRLTPEIRKFLSDEEGYLLECLKQIPEGQALLEVGCGYGRYLKAAIGQGRHYEGVDLVGWLVRLGQDRVKKMKKKFPNVSAHIAQASITEIRSITESMRRVGLNDKPLVLFPFNCLGNIPMADDVMVEIAKCKLPIAVSTFTTAPVAGKARSEYYRSLGLNDLTITEVNGDVLMESREGFSSYARSLGYFKNLAVSVGYEISEEYTYSNGVGKLLIMTPANAQIVRGGLRLVETIDLRKHRRQECKIDARLRMLEERDHTDDADEAMLLSFSYTDAVVGNCNAGGARILTEKPLGVGSMGQLLIDIPGEGSKVSVQILFEVVRSVQQEPGQYSAGARFVEGQCDGVQQLMAALGLLV